MIKSNSLYMKGLSLIVLLAILPAALWAQVIRGQVFLDKNENQTRDKGERGIRQVWVSNGADMVQTDRKGYYSITAKPGQSIFPILPSDYTTSTKQAAQRGNAAFYYLDPQLADLPTEVNFALKAEKQAETFRIGAIGDVQVDNQEEFSYAARSILQELSQREDLAFNIILGDLVNNNMDLLAPLKSAFAGLPMPSWTLMGNHDRNVDHAGSMDDVFNRNFGADTYAFNYAQVHFIILNNIYATGRRSYEGRISEDQLEFLKNDLQQIDKETTVVISQHIPMAQTRNKAEVLALLEGFKQVLFLSGHTHQIHRYSYENKAIHELGAGATCGTWWRGEKNAAGIPDALMQDGSPRGYFVVEFNQGDYRFRYKGVGLDAHKQMALYTDSTKRKVIVNVYGGSAQTQVHMQIDSLDDITLERRRQVDPRVVQLVKRYKEKIYPTPGSTRIPLGNRPSSHIWEAMLPESLKPGMHKVIIRAEDAYGYQVSQVFFLEK